MYIITKLNESSHLKKMPSVPIGSHYGVRRIFLKGRCFTIGYRMWCRAMQPWKSRWAGGRGGGAPITPTLLCSSSFSQTRGRRILQYNDRPLWLESEHKYNNNNNNNNNNTTTANGAKWGVWSPYSNPFPVRVRAYLSVYTGWPRKKRNSRFLGTLLWSTVIFFTLLGRA